jgi:hypothetical protein
MTERVTSRQAQPSARSRPRRVGVYAESGDRENFLSPRTWMPQRVAANYWPSVIPACIGTFSLASLRQMYLLLHATCATSHDPRPKP